MRAIPKTQLSPQDYLALERKASFKSEYYKGKMFAMSGARRNHNMVTGNTLSIINMFLRGKPCTVFPSDMRLHIPATGLYTYPDLLVVCGKEEFVDNEFDTLTNPVIIVEVLSESTEKYDRGNKFLFCRSIPSLREYLMISSDRICVEKYALNERNHWELSDALTLQDSIHLDSIDFTLQLADVYDKVQFEEGKDSASPPSSR